MAETDYSKMTPEEVLRLALGQDPSGAQKQDMGQTGGKGAGGGAGEEIDKMLPIPVFGQFGGYEKVRIPFYKPQQSAYGANDIPDKYNPYIMGAGQQAARFQDRRYDPINMLEQAGDYDNSLAARRDQGALLESYNQALAGNAPSAAQAQLQSGLDQANRQTLAMAANSRGGAGNAMALSDAMRQMSNASTDVAGRAAALRAQEMDSYRQGASGLSQAMRGQDLATRQSSLEAARMPAEMQMKRFALNDAAAQAERDRQLKLLGLQQGMYDRDQRANIQYQQDLINSFYRSREIEVGGNAPGDKDRRESSRASLGALLKAVGVPTGLSTWHIHPTSSSLRTDMSL